MVRSPRLSAVLDLPKPSPVGRRLEAGVALASSGGAERDVMRPAVPREGQRICFFSSRE